MGIRKFYRKRSKPGWKYDAKRDAYWSWGFDIYSAATKARIREGGFLNKRHAEQAAANFNQNELAGRHGLPQGNIPTVKQLTERRIKAIEDKRERVRSERTFRHLLDILPSLTVDRLTTAHLQAFVDKRLADGLKPSSIDRELNIIVAMLNQAREIYPQLEGWVRPRTPRPKGRKARRERVLTTEEVAKLLTYLLDAGRKPGEDPRRPANRVLVGQILKFALMTGARHGEIDNIRWEHIDWERRTVQILGVKGENRSESIARYVPITDAMMEILLNRKAKNSDRPFVFTRSGNTSPSFYTILRKAADANGIPYGRKTDGGFVIHDARHGFVTNLLHAGVDLATIQSLTGHSSRAMALTYAHASQQSRTLAANIAAEMLVPKEEKP